MFLDVLNWMLAHVPAFLRPAVNWLLEGLRNITNYISQRWNTLGHSVNNWLMRVTYWGTTILRFAVKLSDFAVWLVRVRIPGAIAVAIAATVSVLNGAIQAVRDLTVALVAQLRTWAVAAMDLLILQLNSVLGFAKAWIDRIRDTISGLIGALAHVLNGPEALAQWLVASMWRVSLRFLRSQQDRIALWLTRESVAFTRWLTTELENIILRWL